jgi:hypothetical protein
LLGTAQLREMYIKIRLFNELYLKKLEKLENIEKSALQGNGRRETVFKMLHHFI